MTAAGAAVALESEIATSQALGKGDDRNAELTRRAPHGAGDAGASAQVPGRLDQHAGADTPADGVDSQRGDERGGGRVLRRGELPQRPPRALAADLRGHAGAQGPQAEAGQLLPRGRAGALPEGRQGAGRRGGRDVRHGHEHPQGAAGGREDGRGEALQGPGGRDRPRPGRRRLRAALPRSVGLPDALPVAGRDLREVQEGRPGRLRRRRHRDRLRRARLEARAGPVGGGHRVARLLVGVPEGREGPRGRRRDARHLGRSRGAHEGDRRGLPGRRGSAARCA